MKTETGEYINVFMEIRQYVKVSRKTFIGPFYRRKCSDKGKY